MAQLVSDYEAGMSALQLAKREGCSLNTVLNRLREAGIEIRPAGARHATKELNFGPQQHVRFLEIVDGLLLGDGSINKAGALQVSQRSECGEWLESLACLCDAVGVANGITPEWFRGDAQIDGRIVRSRGARTFYAHTYQETKNQRLRWYPDNVKRLPEDVSLSPLSVALWYCGDGTGAKNGTMSFATQNFTKEEVERLAETLSVVYGVSAKPGQSRDGPVMVLYRRDDCMRIKKAIQEFVPACFTYKLDHIRAAIPRGRSLRRLTPSQVRQIRRQHTKGISAAELGRQYRVSNVSVLNLLSRRTYKDVE